MKYVPHGKQLWSGLKLVFLVGVNLIDTEFKFPIFDGMTNHRKISCCSKEGENNIEEVYFVDARAYADGNSACTNFPNRKTREINMMTTNLKIYIELVGIVQYYS